MKLEGILPETMLEVNHRAGTQLCFVAPDSILVDDTYSLTAVNAGTGKVTGRVPVTSSNVKCVMADHVFLIVGLTTGEIQLYDAVTLEFLHQVQTISGVPTAIASFENGILTVGTSLGTIEQFQYSRDKLDPLILGPGNQTTVLNAGEIF